MKRLGMILALALAACSSLPTNTSAKPDMSIWYNNFYKINLTDSTGKKLDPSQIAYHNPSADLKIENGVITPLKEGVFKIRFAPKAEPKDLTTYTIKVNEVKPDLGNRQFSWYSSDPSVASVDNKTGEVTKVSPGRVNICRQPAFNDTSVQICMEITVT